MEPQHPHRWLTIEAVGEVAVARFVPDVVLTGQEAQAIAEHLLALLAEPGRRLLLDFANVRSLSSLMLGKLVEFKRAAESAGGRVALCSPQPDVRAILELTRLTRVLPVYPGEQEALQSF